MYLYNDPTFTEIYSLSLHDALPISRRHRCRRPDSARRTAAPGRVLSRRRVAGSMSSVSPLRSEEHTSELQSRRDLVCRLLLEKKIGSRSLRTPLMVKLLRILCDGVR